MARENNNPTDNSASDSAAHDSAPAADSGLMGDSNADHNKDNGGMGNGNIDSGTDGYIDENSGTGEFADENTTNADTSRDTSRDTSKDPVGSAVDNVVTDAQNAVDEITGGMSVWGVVIAVVIIGAIAALIFAFFTKKK